MTKSSMKSTIVNLAVSQNAQWPQYKGYWEGSEWKLVIGKQTIRSKLGVALEKGEVVIARPLTGQSAIQNPGCIELYSARNRCNTIVTANKVSFLE